MAVLVVLGMLAPVLGGGSGTPPVAMTGSLVPATSSLTTLPYEYLLGLNETFWSQGITGNGTTIAVLDTGINVNHEVFAGKTITYTDATSDAIATPVDIDGHGTACASIAAGNSSTFTGTAPGASIAAVKMFFLKDGNPHAENEDAIAAVDKVIDMKDEWEVKVASLSWGDENKSDGRDPLSMAVDRLVDAGIVTVVAAGNVDGSLRHVAAPGASAKVITVGAYNPSTGTIPSFNLRGPTTDGRVKPDVVAPGTGVAAASHLGPASYKTMTGTSSATPIVAGVASLLLDRYPTLKHFDMKHLLCLTALETTSKGGLPDNNEGWGLVNPAGAVMVMDNTWNVSNPLWFTINTSIAKYRSHFTRVNLTSGDHRIEIHDAGTVDGDARMLQTYLFETTGDMDGVPAMVSTSRGNRLLARVPGGEYILAVKPAPGTWTGGTGGLAGTFELRWARTTEMDSALAWGIVLACSSAGLATATVLVPASRAMEKKEMVRDASQ